MRQTGLIIRLHRRDTPFNDTGTATFAFRSDGPRRLSSSLTIFSRLSTHSQRIWLPDSTVAFAAALRVLFWSEPHPTITQSFRKKRISRDRAFEYYDFFSSPTPESTGGWHQIEFLPQARWGEIIAWRFAEIEEGQDTGHVFFVAETPGTIDSGIFAVRVYDSAAEPHFDDTRGNEDGAFKSSVRSSFIYFTVNDSSRLRIPGDGDRRFRAIVITIPG